MAQEGLSRLRLSVWRPAARVRELDYARGDGDAPPPQVFDASRLQEEVYYWDLQEDVWASLKEPNTATQLRDMFIQKFSPNFGPDKRSMQLFRRCVEELADSLRDESKSTWSDAMQTVSVAGRERVNLRLNGAIAFLNHLEWILRVFGDVPGASVTIR